jgi:hypothetical protein
VKDLPNRRDVGCLINAEHFQAYQVVMELYVWRNASADWTCSVHVRHPCVAQIVKLGFIHLYVGKRVFVDNDVFELAKNDLARWSVYARKGYLFLYLASGHPAVIIEVI